MATDTTTNQTETAHNTSTIHESDVEQVHLTQSGTPVQVQVPQGENVVRIQVTPGETVELPFPADGLVARLGDNGNLAVKVGDVTVILLGYADAVGQGEVTLVGNDGQPVDVAAVLAATDPNLDIQTAAGPGAGDQGAGVDNNGGVFAPFDPAAGLGGLNAVGGLDPTLLNYNLIQRNFIEIIEADEVDTAPQIISIKQGSPVNEDDLGGEQGEVSLSAKALEDHPSHILDDLSDKVGGSFSWWGFPYESGNDPFDTTDHEDGSQIDGLPDDNNGAADGGVDQDREPLTTTAVVTVDFLGDVPGHISFINGGATPIVDQLAAMNLTSHGHELQFVVLPGSPDTDPNDGVDDSYGETLVAYYADGEGGNTVVFTIAIREFDNSTAPADFDIDFTIYGVVDNVPNIADAIGDITDALDIGVPFFVVDSDGTVTPAPDGALIFTDIDDTPSLGSLCYEWTNIGGEGEGQGDWAYLPVDIKPTDTDIVHDETPGVQPGNSQDDVNPNSNSWPDYASYQRGEALAAAGLPNNTTLLGMAAMHVTVSFGADGAAQGNKEAGKTIFTGDNDTFSQAYQLYLGTVEAPTSGGSTNWTITENNVVLDVKAEQVDANTIVGYAEDGEGNRIEVFVLRIDPNSGEVVILQLHQVNQADGANPDDPTPSLLVDGQPVNFAGTDYDGDHVTSPLQVVIQDDGPKAYNDYAIVDETHDTDPNTPGTQAGVTGNLITGVSNDGVWWNNVGQDKLSVDHNHTIPQIKYGDSTLAIDFVNGTVQNNGVGAGDDGHNVSNVAYDPVTGVLSFDTPHGHFSVVVKSPEVDNDSIPNSTDTNELGYYEYTPKAGTSSDKEHHGLPTNANGTDLPQGANDSAKIVSILQSFGSLTLSNNQGGNDTSANNWGFKEVTAGGKTYSGIAVGGGIDGGETDTDGNSQGPAAETITIKFPSDTDAAKITLGALFDGQLHDDGNAEAVKWEAWDGNTKVGEGVVYGGYDGLVSFFINTGHDFDTVKLTPLDNGAGHNGNNTDFLLVGVDTCDDLCVQEKIEYTLKDGDGDTSKATLTIDVLDGEPKITSCEADLNITIDEDGLPHGNNNNVNNPSGDGADNVGGDNGPGDADGNEATAQGHISYNTYTDGLGAVSLSSNSNLHTLDGKSITWAWDPSNNRLVGYATPDTDRIVVEVQLSNANDGGVDFKVILHEPLDHPANSTEDNLYLDVKVTVADKDCDIDTANIHVKIDDDVPTVTIQALSNGAVDIDESPDNQRDDRNNNDASQALKNVSNSGSIIEYAKDGDPVVSVNAHFGADGAATNNSVVFAVKASSNGVDSGLDFKDSGGALRNITLTTENGVVVGRVSGGPDNGKAVFAVTIDQDGELEVAQYRPIHHNNTNSNDEFLSILNGALQATVTVTDGDGDKATSSANIGDKVNFYDDGPSVSSNDVVLKDDDALSGGNSGGTGDNANSDNATGTLAHNYGTDGAGTTLLSNANLPGGMGFTQNTSADGKTLTILQNGTPVLQIVLSNTTSGNYTVTQLAPIKHADGNNENNVEFTVNYQVKDNDGDTVNGTMKINVDDDTPTVSSNADVKLDDDALAGGNPNGTNDDVNAQNVTGTLSHSYGADGAGSTLLTSANLPGGMGFTQNTSADGKTLTILQNGTPVLQIVLSNTTGGSYTVTQLAAIKHAGGSTENNVEFTVNYQVKDSDNDTVNGSIKINVDDDTPTVSSNAAVQLDDDDKANGNPGGTNDDLAPVNATGVLAHSYGADGAGTTLLTGAGLPAGFTQSVSVDGMTVFISQNGVPVLEIKLSDTTGGNYTVTQISPIHHADGSTENNVEFTVNYQVKDSDGDIVNGSMKINVDDDTPTVGSSIQFTVDEDSKNFNNDGSNDDGLPGGIQGGPGDANGGNPDYIGFAGKSLNISYGADGPGVNPITFSTSFVAKDANGTPMTLKSGGVDVVLTWVGNVLHGMAGGNEVFTLTVHQADGTVDFQLKAPIDHPFDNGNNTPGDTGGEYEDMVRLELGFTAKDADGDSVPGTVIINVNDDSPDACCLDAVIIKEVSETHLVEAGSVTIDPSNYQGNAQVHISVTVPGDANASLNVNQNEGGVDAFGITSSVDGDGEARFNEINYIGDGSNTTSEVMSFELQNDAGEAAEGKWAVSANVEINVFFGQEGSVGDEVGTYTLYRDGVAVAGPISFVALDSSGHFTLPISFPAGFDEIRFAAATGTTDGNGNTAGDSSDYNVKSVTLNLATEVSTPTEITGKVCADFGADGPAADGGIALALENGGATGVKHDGVDVVNHLSSDGNTILGMAGDVVVWKLTIVDATKDYTFTLYEPIDGEVDPTLHFVTVATDRDGDSDQGCITVTIDQNDIPTLTVSYDQTIDPAKGFVDEDFLNGGEQDNPVSPGDGPGGVSATGTYDANFKSDTPGTVALTVVEGADTGIDTLSGANILWHQVSATQVVGYIAGGDPSNVADQYFTLNLTPGADAGNTGDGTWNFTLLKPVDHPSAGTEDDLNLSVGMIATDSNGDTAAGSISIVIDDDVPTVVFSIIAFQGGGSGASPNPGFQGPLDEDSLPQGNHDSTSSPGDQVGPLTVNAYAGIHAGADGLDSTYLSGITVTGADGDALRRSSDGAKVLFVTSPDGQSIIGYADADNSGSISDAEKIDANKVVSATLNGLSVVTFTLYQALQHDSTDADINSGDGNIESNITFGVTLTVKDKDGDTASDTVNFVVNDDSVDAVNDATLGIASLNVDTAGTNLLANDLIGADAPGTLTQVTFTNGAQNVAGGGSDFFVDAAGNKLDNATGSVGILHIEQDGDWSFKQTATSNAADLNFTYNVVDKDGDSDTATFGVNLKNGTPPSFTATTAFVDEDGLPNGFGNSTTAVDGQPGDDVTGAGPSDTSEKTYEGTFGLGAQGITSMSLGTTTTADLANFKNLAGVAVDTLVFTNGDKTMVAWAGGVQLVKVEITNASTGAYTVTLLNPIKHADSATEDNITANVKVTATNESGSQTNNLIINVDDDRPTASTNADVIVDDDNQANGNNSQAAGTGDDTPQNATGGTLAHTYGADGAGSTLLTSATLPATGGFTQALSNGGKTIIISQDGIAVLQIVLTNDTTGAYTVTQLKPIKHPAGDNENNYDFTINYVVKDGDGDTVPGTVKIIVDDDVPLVVNDTDTVTTFGVAETGNVLANDHVGADTPGKVLTFTIDGNNYNADGQPHNIPNHGSMTMHSDGSYSFTQTSGGAGSFNIGYTMEDADHDQVSGTLVMTTKDQPIQNYIVVGENVDDNANQTTDHRLDNSPNQPDGSIDGTGGKDVLIGDVGGKQTIVVPGVPYSIALICDTSSSMSDGDRIGLMKEAVSNFVDTMPTGGTVTIRLISFGSVAATEITLTLTAGNKQQLLDQIDDLEAGQNNGGSGSSFTNYEAAILAAKSFIDGQPAGNEKLVYFMTDGEPTAHNSDHNGDSDGNTDLAEINPALAAVNAWMVAGSPVKLHAIGIDIGASAMNLLRYFDNTNLQVGTVQTSVQGGSVTDNYGQPLNIENADELTAALVGGGSTDTIFPVGNDVINGGNGDDAILGDSIYSGGKDLGWANYIAAHSLLTAEEIRSDIYDNLTSSNATYAQEGSVGGNDTINGGAGNDIIFGQGGNDTIHGDADNDKISGGSGNDTLFGDAGNDTLSGGDGNDTMSGGDGNDTLVGGAGTDVLNGNDGDDTLVWDSSDSFNGGAGFDRLQIQTNSDLTFNNDGAGSKHAGIEMIDLGDSNHNFDNTVTINADDVLDLGNAGTAIVGPDGNTYRVDLFVIGDNANGTNDNVAFNDGDGSGGFNNFSRVDVQPGGGDGVINYLDPVTGVSHNYQIWQSNNGGTVITVAVEDGLSITSN